MRMVKAQEIQELYKKCGLEKKSIGKIRRDINIGNLNSKLNSNFSNIYGKTFANTLSNATLMK